MKLRSNTSPLQYHKPCSIFRTYVHRPNASGWLHEEPLFPIEMWNQHHEVFQGIPRTNNSVESWHRSYNATVVCHHPNIWCFIDAQGLVEVKQGKFLAGERPTRRQKDKVNEEELKSLILSYFHRQPIEFLQGVAHRIGMNDA